MAALAWRNIDFDGRADSLPAFGVPHDLDLFVGRMVENHCAGDNEPIHNGCTTRVTDRFYVDAVVFQHGPSGSCRDHNLYLSSSRLMFWLGLASDRTRPVAPFSAS